MIGWEFSESATTLIYSAEGDNQEADIPCAR